MSEVRISVDGRDVAVPEGGTVLQAAEKLGVRIPTLCHLDGFEPFTSCMVCVVHDVAADRLVPACSAPAAEGMRVETDTDRVREARRDALDFLLGEHAGDCEAPCRRACPAGMDIPQMIREIKGGRLGEAIRTVKRDIAVPAVLGRICPAPCEKGCHRGALDESVSICALKRYVADADLASVSPYRPEVKAASGKQVAVVGAGPAGLAAAYYLLQYGHACHVHDRNPLPGGALRYGVSREDLPESVLDAEIGRIIALGAEMRMGRALGRDMSLEDLRNDYDAVVLAVGQADPGLFEKTGIESGARGILIDRRTYETKVRGVFAGGNAVSPSRMAVRAAAHGKGMAFSVDRFLAASAAEGPGRRFDSTLGKLRDGEAEEFLKESESYGRTAPTGGPRSGYTPGEAGRESARCFGCDCRKRESCRLRLYADETGAEGRRFRFAGRTPVRKIIQHDRVVYEPGKCVKCGSCVRIAARAKEELGLTFVGRGFDVRVEAPFGEPFGRGLLKTAAACVAACPTAALSWRERNADEQ